MLVMDCMRNFANSRISGNDNPRPTTGILLLLALEETTLLQYTIHNPNNSLLVDSNGRLVVWNGIVASPAFTALLDEI